ncbi:hypothetical protein BpHYR1_001380 [Brachionus plicatilis]|uniref:Uncharacterized protein n=1 Tax=Brachionus plicatilis TaxID=10195 RepID=A0A3M7RE28_BRAPC|nr:hypothetical protein BpHYR1_001380 [Brachionus plicatilis]
MVFNFSTGHISSDNVTILQRFKNIIDNCVLVASITTTPTLANLNVYSAILRSHAFSKLLARSGHLLIK